jgi:hypothetical protein
MTKTRNARYWEDRAEETLARLEEVTDEGARRILFRIYHDYVRLARLAGEQPKTAASAERPELDG